MLDDSVLDLDPIGRAACAVGTVPALRHKTLKPEIAGLPEQVGPISPCSNWLTKIPSGRRASNRARCSFEGAAAVSANRRHPTPRYRTLELNLVIMPAGVQTVEIGDAVDAQQHRLAIDDERSRSVLQRGLDDQRITISPVVSVCG